jgi:hypothetical protein
MGRTAILVLVLILGGGCSPAVDQERILAELERAKSDAPLAERLNAAEAVLQGVGDPMEAPKSLRGAVLVATGVAAWVRSEQGDFQGAERGRVKHRELARAYVAKDANDFESRGHLAQLLAEDRAMDAAWQTLLAAPDPKTPGDQELWLRAATLVHARYVERLDTAGELAALPRYAELVQRARESRAITHPDDPVLLEWLARECALRVRSGAKEQGEALLAKAEALNAGSLAVVRMRDILGKGLELPSGQR